MTEMSKTMKKPMNAMSQTPTTAAAILGRPMARKSATSAGPKKIKPEWQKYYQRLLELREQLLHQMNGLAQESAQEVPGYSLHMADSGTDNFDRDFALSLLSSDQDAVYEIEEALKRIEKKTYGVCELTGKAHPQGAPGRHSVDAIPGRSAGAIGARRRLAPAPVGRARHD